MFSGIVDSEVHLVRVESEFDLLGLSIYAHLSALPERLSKSDLNLLGPLPTIRGIGGLYNRRRKMPGYASGWPGKAFEYAVAELFNRRMKPYYSLICEGIDLARSILVSDQVARVDLNIGNLSCIRVSEECADAEDLVAEFGRFRMLRDARRGLKNATTHKYPGLTRPVDVVFCERDTDLDYRFAVLATLKIGRGRLLEKKTRRDLQAYPIDLAITVETPRYRGVMFDEKLGITVVYLPLHVPSGVYAWERATSIVETALREGDKNTILRILRKWLPPNSPEDHWTRFLADRLNVNAEQVVQEILQMLSQTPRERTRIFPVLLGAEKDTVLDLGIGVAA